MAARRRRTATLRALAPALHASSASPRPRPGDRRRATFAEHTLCPVPRAQEAKGPLTSRSPLIPLSLTLLSPGNQLGNPVTSAPPPPRAPQPSPDGHRAPSCVRSRPTWTSRRPPTCVRRSAGPPAVPPRSKASLFAAGVGLRLRRRTRRRPGGSSPPAVGRLGPRLLGAGPCLAALVPRSPSRCALGRLRAGGAARFGSAPGWARSNICVGRHPAPKRRLGASRPGRPLRFPAPRPLTVPADPHLVASQRHPPPAGQAIAGSGRRGGVLLAPDAPGAPRRVPGPSLGARFRSPAPPASGRRRRRRARDALTRRPALAGAASGAAPAVPPWARE